MMQQGQPYQAKVPGYRQLFSGGRPMNVVCAGSGSGSNIEAMLSYAGQNPGLMRVVGIFTDKKGSDVANIAMRENEHSKELFVAGKLDYIVKPMVHSRLLTLRDDPRFGGKFATPESRMTPEAAIAYDTFIVEQLDRLQDDLGQEIDMIALGGYMLLVKNPLLRAFPDKILNVHPAKFDLLEQDGAGQYRRVLVGDDPVSDSFLIGHLTTASTVHIVTAATDNGESLVQSQDIQVPIKKGLLGVLNEAIEAQEFKEARTIIEDIIHTYNDLISAEGFNPKITSGQNLNAAATSFEVATRLIAGTYHQELQKIIGDWPAYVTALRYVAEGRFAVSDMERHPEGWRKVTLDHRSVPMSGHKLRMVRYHEGDVLQMRKDLISKFTS